MASSAPSPTSTTVTFVQPRQIALIEAPTARPGPNQIAVETRASLISTGTELTGYSGDFPPGDSAWARYIRYPFAAGYSNVGRVVEVGASVTGPRPGERVVSQAPHATYVLVDRASAMRLPDGVSDEEGTFWVLGMTVMNGVRLAQIQLGEAVVIVGAGLLGQLATAMCALSGAWPLIVIDVAEGRLELARARGATHTIAADVGAAKERVREILGGRDADVVFEITGSPKVVPGALKLARRRGRVIMLGSSRGPSQVDFHDEVHTLGLQVIGAHISTTPEHETPYTPWTKERNGALFLDLIAARRLRVDDLISHRFPLRQAADAYEFLLADRSRAMGVLLTY